MCVNCCCVLWTVTKVETVCTCLGESVIQLRLSGRKPHRLGLLYKQKVLLQGVCSEGEALPTDSGFYWGWKAPKQGWPCAHGVTLSFLRHTAESQRATWTTVRKRYIVLLSCLFSVRCPVEGTCQTRHSEILESEWLVKSKKVCWWLVMEKSQIWSGEVIFCFIMTLNNMQWLSRVHEL